jgi:hypothetical protein
MHRGPGALLASPFIAIALSRYFGETTHHLLVVVAILFAVSVLVSGIVRRSLELRRRRSL